MFWKTLNWIQDNWKSIALLGLPVLISFIARLLSKNDSLENKLEMKEKEIEVSKEAAQLEAAQREEARLQNKELLAAAERTHDALIIQIKEDMANRIEEIETADQATEAIKEKLEEPGWKKVKPEDVKPPMYPDPRKVATKRPCPCGSGFKYKYCHAKQWSPK